MGIVLIFLFALAAAVGVAAYLLIVGRGARVLSRRFIVGVVVSLLVQFVALNVLLMVIFKSDIRGMF